MKRTLSAFTLIEVLIALAIIAVAMGAMSFLQVTNLRASASSRVATNVKAAANQVLEAQMALVLSTEPGPPLSSYTDEDGTAYSFNDYYWSCPSVQPPSLGSLAINPASTVSCEGQETIGDVNVEYVIYGLPGISGEGVLEVRVSAVDNRGLLPALTIGDRVTCYDVYPSPTSTTPAPCPSPTLDGAGRQPEPENPGEEPAGSVGETQP